MTSSKRISSAELNEIYQQITRLCESHYLIPPPSLSTVELNLTDQRKRLIELFQSYIQHSIRSLKIRSFLLQKSKHDLRQLAAKRRSACLKTYEGWINPATQLKQLNLQANRVYQLNRDYFLKMITPSRTGRIFQEFAHSIQNLETLEQAVAFLNSFAAELKEAVSQECSSLQERVLRQLQQLAATEEIDAMGFSRFESGLLSEVESILAKDDTVNPSSTRNIWGMVKAIRYDVLVAGSLNPISQVSLLISSIATLLSIKFTTEQQLQTLRRELIRILNDNLAEIYGILTLPDIDNLRGNIVDEFLSELITDAINDMKSLARFQYIVYRYECELFSHVSGGTNSSDDIESQIGEWTELLGRLSPGKQM